MDKKIKRFMAECHENKRKRFDLDDLEKYIIKARAATQTTRLQILLQKPNS